MYITITMYVAREDACRAAVRAAVTPAYAPAFGLCL